MANNKKLEEARLILAALGMPAAQQNPNAVHTLLAFANVGPRATWAQARDLRLTPHDVIAFAARAYKKIYAENTRETIRRQAIHQFVQGGILMRNPDEPELATNSPRTHYALTREALDAIRAFGTREFAAIGVAFRNAQGGGLAARYARGRTQAHVPVALPGGVDIVLSPGAHNRLQERVISEFMPRFAPDARVLYLGDTDEKGKVVEEARLHALGIAVTSHDKLPDIVLFDDRRGWLFLIEVVTSHGPVSAKRHHELEELVRETKAGRVYVSAFPTFREFKRYANQIAWETEVWIAEAAEHLLHYNGDRFVGPR